MGCALWSRKQTQSPSLLTPTGRGCSTTALRQMALEVG